MHARLLPLSAIYVACRCQHATGMLFHSISPQSVQPDCGPPHHIPTPPHPTPPQPNPNASHLRLRTINPDNVAEVYGTLLSALHAQHSINHTLQPVFSWRQHYPTPHHAKELLQRVTGHVWRRGKVVGNSDLRTGRVCCYPLHTHEVGASLQ